MGKFELALVSFIIFISLAILILPVKKRVITYAAISGIVLLFTLHFTVEGYRWQMIPTYSLCSLMLLFLIRRTRGTAILTSRWKRGGFYLFLLIWIPIAIVLPILFPVFQLPEPTGIYKIGRISYHLIDPNRNEIETKIQNDKRELSITVWYPTNETDHKQATYFPNFTNLKDAVSEKYGIPPFLLTYLGKITTNTQEGVAVANNNKPFPVIVLSHGFPGTSFMFTSLIEEVVSHGFIVAAIDHTFYSNVTMLPTNKAVFLTENLPTPIEFEKWDEIIDTVWVKDQIQVIDFLSYLNREKKFKNKIDLDKIGVMGHSFGGATAFQSMLIDDRIKAGINMDGTYFGNAEKSEMDVKPFLLMNTSEEKKESKEDKTAALVASGLSEKQFQQISQSLEERQQKFRDYGGYVASIIGAKHMSFSDYYLFSPALSIGENVNYREDQKIIRWTVLQFFEKTLNKNNRTIFDDSNKPYSRLTLSTLSAK